MNFHVAYVQQKKWSLLDLVSLQSTVDAAGARRLGQVDGTSVSNGRCRRGDFITGCETCSRYSQEEAVGGVGGFAQGGTHFRRGQSQVLDQVETLVHNHQPAESVQRAQELNQQVIVWLHLFIDKLYENEKSHNYL